jgi:hypothetical protein
MNTTRLGSTFEPLEPRCVPTAFGVPWADPSRLTLSFTPDNTPALSGPSTLHSKLNAVAPPAAWQREILRAFQTWAAFTNVNIGLVADGGQPLGALGAPQGDKRFGDVRVAAAPMSAGVVGSASPFSWSGTTLGGDLFLNSNAPYRAGGSGAGYDLYSVALHEAGHVLGLDHSADPRSVMAGRYSDRTNPLDGCCCPGCLSRTGLTAGDVAAVRAMYGTRTPDAADAAGGNDSFARAGGIPSAGALTGRLSTEGDLTTASDVDFYRFTTPLGLGLTGLSIRLKAEGLSLLTPKVTVYDAAGRVVASGVSYDPTNNDVLVRVANPRGLSTYFVKVEGATDDVFGIGGYQLDVGFEYWGVLNTLNPVLSLTAPVLDLGRDDLLGNAVSLLPRVGAEADARFDYTHRASVESSSDVDSYRVRAPGGAGPVNLNVMVWALEEQGLRPRVKVFDAAQRPVAFRVLANEAGVMSVVVPNAAAGAEYFIQVSGQDGSRGGYFLGVDFNRLAPPTFDGIGTGTLQPGSSTTATLDVTRDGVFQFALGAEALAAGGGGVTLTVTDEAGRVVATVSGDGGRLAATRVTYLAAGRYTLRYDYRPTGGTSAAVRFQLALLRLSEGVGPYATDSTASGEGQFQESESHNAGYSYSGHSTSFWSGEAYYF